MGNNDWNNLGRDIKDIVQEALDTGDFRRLNRDLGVTVENALGNVANSVKDAAKKGINNGMNYGQKGMDQETGNNGQTYGPDGNKGSYGPYQENGRFEGYGRPRSRSYSTFSPRHENRRVKEAREKFALYVNTGTPRALGILFTALGFALVGMFGVTVVTLGICSLFIETIAAKMGAFLTIFIPAIVISLGMGMYGNHTRKKVARFRSYVHTLNGKTYARISDLARGVRKSERFVRRDLKKMIKKYMFLEGHLDEKGTCLITSDESYKLYLETQKQAEIQEKEKEMGQKAEEQKTADNPVEDAVKEVIREGNAYIEQIRRSNDAIPGVEISNKMYHLENVIQRIFKRVEKHPELIDDLHKFMDYYLPTTVKLLKAYEELDKQDVEGENIKTAKKEIENTLDTINEAFENLLDSFFRDTAWDVSSDISVLKTMLAQEGLTGNDDFQKKE